MGHNLFLLSPMLLVAANGLLLMMAGAFTPDEQKKSYLAYLTVLGNVAALLATAWLWRKGGGDFTADASYLTTMLAVNRYTLFFSGIILVTSSLVALYSAEYAEKQGFSNGEYYTLLSFATFGMLVLVHSNNLISLFVGLEVMSISSYVLAGIRRRYLRSTEASMKYFIMGAFSSALLLYGIALLYGLTGETNLHFINYVLTGLSSKGMLSDKVLIVGVVMLIVAFGFKIAAVPFHMWAPDVYEGAPTPVTAFFAGGVKAASFAALIKVLLTLRVDAILVKQLPARQIFLWVAVVTMFAGNLIALYQTNIKRMLAYSSVAHAGYLMLGLFAAIEVNRGIPASYDPQPMAAILFYFAVYTAATLGAFGIISVLAKKGDERLAISDYAGLSTVHPWLALAMLIFMISLAGIPPTAGFMGKYYLFKEVLQMGIGKETNLFTILVVLGVVNSVISVGYYLRIVVAMYMKPKTEEFEGGASKAAVVALVVAMFIVLHAGLSPKRYLRWSKKSSVTLDQHAPKQKLSTENKLARQQLGLPLSRRGAQR